MPEFEIKEKEAKEVTFTIKDEYAVAIDVSSATLTFEIKSDMSDTSALITKDDADFDKSQATSGIVSITLTTEDTDRIGDFLGELKIEFSATNIDKSDIIYIKILEAVTN